VTACARGALRNLACRFKPVLPLMNKNQFRELLKIRLALERITIETGAPRIIEDNGLPD